MYFAAISQVEGYWHGLFASGQIPARADVDPRGIETALHHAFLLERVAPGVARLRLAGMQLHDLMGMEVRGMPLSAMFTPDTRTTLAGAIDLVCDKQCLCDLELESSAGLGRGLLHGRVFMAPLRDEFGKVSRILGCLEVKGDLGRTPRRFDTVRARFRELDTVRFAEPEKAPRLRQVAFAEEQAPYVAPPKRSDNQPRIRLVYSAD